MDFPTAAADWNGKNAWLALDTKLRPFVARRITRSADIDDVLQDIFLRIQRGLPGLRDETRFAPWVYEVARNAVRDHERGSARLTLTDGDLPQPLSETEQPAEEDETAVQQEVAAYAALFVRMLPSPYREALTLTELMGLTQKEAADSLGVPLSTLKSRVQRGREKLQAALLDCCDIALDARNRVVGCEPRPDGHLPSDCCGDRRNN